MAPWHSKLSSVNNLLMPPLEPTPIMNSPSIPMNVFEIPVKWWQIRKGLDYAGSKARHFFIPTVAELRRSHSPRSEDKATSVFIQPSPEDIPHLQAWLRQMVANKYSLTAHFEFIEYNYANELSCKGVQINVKDKSLAVLAKLKFG